MAKRRRKDVKVAIPRSSDVMSIRLTESARKKIDVLTTDYISQKTKLVERVLQWFADQPDTVQHAILRPIPGKLADAYAGALEEMARSIRSGNTAAVTGAMTSANGTRTENHEVQPKG